MNRLLPKKTIRPTLCMVLLISVSFSYSQNLKKPVIKFNAPCASADFNKFNVDFEWGTPMVNADNKFILELSDANGNFNNPTTLSTLSDKNYTFKFTFEFSFPTNLAGNHYKIRVKSTNPQKTSEASDPFPAYYVKILEGLVLNNYQDVTICDGSSVTLKVNNYPNETSYNWYKNLNVIPGETSSSLTTSEPGLYFVEINYGDYCSANSASNIVEINASNAYGIELLGDKEVSLCNGDTYKLQANINDPNLTYSWYRNDKLLISNNSYEYVINTGNGVFEGEYYLEIGSSEEDECKEQSSKIKVTAEDFDISLNLEAENILLPGNSAVLSVTTNAKSPKYNWYRDDVKIDGEEDSKIEVIQTGTYKVKVTQYEGCEVYKTSESVNFSAPSSFAITIKNDETYSSCESTKTNLSAQKLLAFTNANKEIVLPEEELNKFSFQWYKNHTPIDGENEKTLSINDYKSNGDYKLQIQNGAYAAYSNSISIKLRLDESLKIDSDGSISCGGDNDVEISANISSADYTYQWYRNGEMTAHEGPVISTSLTGTYQLKMEAFGCSIASNELIINPFDASLITIDSPENIVIPEDTNKTVTASGGDYYQWYDSLGNLLSASSSITLSQEGEYYLKAFIGDCEVTKTITVSYKEIFAIPNVISPNGDGYNDLWILPNTYANREEVTITIFDQRGDIVLNTAGYQNNWPSSSLDYSASRPIFYYKIVKGKEILKQGTITIIR